MPIANHHTLFWKTEACLERETQTHRDTWTKKALINELKSNF